MINFDSLFLQQSDKNNTNLQRKNIKSRNKHREKDFIHYLSQAKIFKYTAFILQFFLKYKARTTMINRNFLPRKYLEVKNAYSHTHTHRKHSHAYCNYLFHKMCGCEIHQKKKVMQWTTPRRRRKKKQSIFVNTRSD